MRQTETFKKLLLVTAMSSGLMLAGCGGDDGKDGADGADGQSTNANASAALAVTTSGFAISEDAIFVAPDAANGDDITEALSVALFDVPEDALVVLPKGRFVVTESIIVNSASGLTLTGHGITETILDFSTSNGDDAFRFQGGNGITVRDLGVYEAPKNGIKATNVNGIRMAYTATVWEGELEANNGAYGLYPLKSQNVLLENNYAFGSADAGIYVGQSENIVVRNNTAKQNVAGIEIENSTMADVYNNIAVGNSGGILVFDLPGLDKAYGGNVRIFNNQSYSNNAANVGAGVVGMVPPGTGALVLATSDVEMYNNQITDNDTTAVAITSYLLVDEDLASYGDNYGATIANGWSPILKNVYLHNNTIARTGANPQGDLLQEVIVGYTSKTDSEGGAQTFPAILYDGIGQLLSNTGDLAPFGYGPYTAGDKICANSNINGNAAPDYHKAATGLVYPAEIADVTLPLVDGAPQPHLLLEESLNSSMYLQCTQPRLAPAVVNFRNTIYGCTGDDLAEAACSL